MQFTAQEIQFARYDTNGVFSAGRESELSALRAMGYRDPSLGRLYEGHFNAVMLVSRYGSDRQRLALRDSLMQGALYGVWNSQADEPVRLLTRGGIRRLGGAKTWASGADTLSHALITAALPGGEKQLCLVPAEKFREQIDYSAWEPLGMHDSRSFRVSFDGIGLDDDECIGQPDDYEREPWFFGGAIRFAAVHAGIVARLVHETIDYCIARRRHEDPLIRERIGNMRILAHGCDAWIDAGRYEWSKYDMRPSETQARAVIDYANMARLAIERAGLDVLELSIRVVGANGLLEPLPFARLFRDLHMYLRQPAPDAALLRVADDGIAHAIASRKEPIASSTGCSSSRAEFASLDSSFAKI